MSAVLALARDSTEHEASDRSIRLPPPRRAHPRPRIYLASLRQADGYVVTLTQAALPMWARIRTIFSMVLLWLLGGCTSIGILEDRTEPRFEIQVKNIGARSLVSLVADFAKLDFTAGEELRNKRVDVSERSISADQLLTRIVRDQGLTTQFLHEMLMIGSACRLAQIPDIPDQGSYREPLSVYFQSVAVNVLIDAFVRVVGAPFDVSAINEQAPISLRIKEKMVRDHIAAVAIVAGWSAQPVADGGMKLVPNEQLKKCAAPTAHPVKAETAISSKLSTRDRPCPIATRSRCAPLEYYTLEEIRLIGFMRWLSSSSPVAIFEAPDGLVYKVQVGEYVGRNYGRITRIAAGEVHLVELVPDNLGGWLEKEVVLRTGVRYEEQGILLRKKLAAPIVATRLQREFVVAAGKGDLHKVEQLAAMGARLDATYSAGEHNALSIAALTHRPDVVALLLRKGTILNILVTQYEEAPLHVAAREGDFDIVKQLVQAGADVDIKDANERTAVEYAAHQNHKPIVAFLISKKATITGANKWGITPFTSAAYAGHSDIVKLFLDNGLRINSRDRNGHTMLTAAASGGRKDLAVLLIELGADLNATTNKRETALDIALTKKHKVVSDLLVLKGAQTSKELVNGL